MTSPRHLLLLAGSGESRLLATALAKQGRGRVTAALLDAPDDFGPLDLPGPSAPFEDAPALRRFVESESVTAILDATHPFADNLNAADIARETGAAHLRLLRPAWAPQPGDRWQTVPDETRAAELLKPGQLVFTNIGRATLGQLVTNPRVTFLARRLGDRDSPGDDWPNVRPITGTPPFSIEEEKALFTLLNIDVLVTRNAGGTPSRSKIDAARALGLPVILIDRPPVPDGVQTVETVAEALDWVAAL